VRDRKGGGGGGQFLKDSKVFAPKSADFTSEEPSPPLSAKCPQWAPLTTDVFYERPLITSLTIVNFCLDLKA